MKKRVRQIIAKLEPERRGIYAGVVRYLGRDGESFFNIAIRTIGGREGSATDSIGADSDPVSAYDETWPKAAGLFAALS
jgi:anthranilate/para-aminobenzoate synthase component I